MRVLVTTWPGPEMTSTDMAKKRFAQKLFTTGEIARIVDIDRKTVVKWIDEGKLRGTYLPNKTERRVYRGHLRVFFVDMEWDYAVEVLDNWGWEEPRN